jgi:hypothetical protein
MLDIGEQQRFERRFEEIRRVNPAQLLIPQNRSKYSIRDVGIGGVLRFNKKTCRVTAISVYQETDDSFRRKKQYFVTELTLFCLETGETHYIEWEIDDQLEVCFTIRELAAKELKYDNQEPVSFDDIDEMADEEETLVFNGQTFDYDDDVSAIWRASDGRNACVFMVDFGNDRTGWITIEGWSDDGDENGDWEYQAFQSVSIAPTSIEILCLGEKGSADGRAV